jgi:hypothetical protein
MLNLMNQEGRADVTSVIYDLKQLFASAISAISWPGWAFVWLF